MSAESAAEKVTLDWRELAPPQESHECDCSYCDMGGDLEPVDWPDLVRMTVGGVEYITDRYLAIRADRAPVPDGYEGPALQPVERQREGFLAARVTDEAPTGRHFRWQIIKAIEATGWRLRVLDYSPLDAARPIAMAVVTAEGEHIGWAVAAKHPNDDAWSDGLTREYAEVTP